MSRSFGDQVANQIGVFCEPEIIEWNLSNEDKFIVLASDGIWEFIDNQECVDIIKDFYLKNDAIGAAKYITDEATKRWIKEENVIDDITVVVVFFNN